MSNICVTFEKIVTTYGDEPIIYKIGSGLQVTLYIPCQRGMASLLFNAISVDIVFATMMFVKVKTIHHMGMAALERAEKKR